MQGYLQARERMAQMDILRRLGSGTLGEAFGVTTDFARVRMRKYGLVTKQKE